MLNNKFFAYFYDLCKCKRKEINFATFRKKKFQIADMQLQNLIK